MVQGTQSLDAVLELARTAGPQLEESFDVPVLLVVSEDEEEEGVTAVTSPGSLRPESVKPKEPVTYVVPIQPRFKGAALRLSFGRSIVCDLNVPCSSISKHHGYFDSIGEVWSVQDAGSTNGTQIDGHPVTKTGAALTDGCALTLGRASARYLSAKAFCAMLRMRLGI